MHLHAHIPQSRLTSRPAACTVASAMIVVLFARNQAAGVTIGQQQCLQRLAASSEAWQATGGSKHFFILTDSRGPCCLDGKYKDVRFMQHHVIGPHAEPEGKASYFRRGEGPPSSAVPCFDVRKDVGIPTPNIHFPRTPFAKPLLASSSAASLAVLRGALMSRSLLMFYAGWNYDTRMALVMAFKDDPDADVVVKRQVDPVEYKQRMLQARFCPVCGGFSQWTPRLAEALHFGCVPVLLSPHLEPPFSSLLNWSTFSVRWDRTRLQTTRRPINTLNT